MKNEIQEKEKVKRRGSMVSCYVAGYVLSIFLVMIGDSPRFRSSFALILYGGMFVISLGLIPITKKLTRHRRWWMIPLFLSPFSCAMELILILNVLLYLNLVSL
jgi:hypothetical protein